MKEKYEIFLRTTAPLMSFWQVCRSFYKKICSFSSLTYSFTSEEPDRRLQSAWEYYPPSHKRWQRLKNWGEPKGYTGAHKILKITRKTTLAIKKNNSNENNLYLQ